MLGVVESSGIGVSLDERHPRSRLAFARMVVILESKVADFIIGERKEGREGGMV